MAKATFSVKNFAEFQHYKDRNPIWIKLYNRLLDDYDFGLLPDASKGHLLAIWLLASRHDNVLPLDPKWVAGRINANSPVDLNILRDGGFIVFNQEDIIVLAERYQVAIPEKRRDTSKNREETESKNAPSALFVLPDFIPSLAWDDFLEMRKKARKPVTERAKAMLAKSLQALMVEGYDPAEILNQSTANCWTDVYPLNTKEARNGRSKPSRNENWLAGASDLAKRLRAEAERE